MFEVAGRPGSQLRPCAVKQAHALVKIPRQPLVVSIEKSYQLAARLRDTCIARRARSGVRLANQTKARVVVVLDNRRAWIRRAVIDDDHFKVSERLGRNRT